MILHAILWWEREVQDEIRKMGKISFWGYESRVNYRVTSAHKYRYVKHIIGPEKREVYVKIPNIDYMRKVIQARKLMYMNYVFGGSYPDPLTKNWTQWQEAVTGFKNSKMKRKYSNPRKKKPDILDAIEADASQTADHEREAKNESCLHVSGSQKTLESKSAGSDGSCSKRKDQGKVSSVASRNSDAEGVQQIPVTGRTSSAIELDSYSSPDSDYFVETNLTRADGKVTTSCNPDDYSDQRKQSELALKIRKFRESTEANEVLLRSRLASLNSSEASSYLSACCILLETMQAGIHSHDWSLVLKCAEGLSREITKKPERHWILWNGGFLGLINVYKNDISKVLEFASHAREIMLPYPVRLKLEVATWLTQKGYFTNAAFMIGEEEELRQWNQVTFKNPKRNAMDFIAAVFRAVNEYCLYNSDKARLQQREQNNAVPEEEREALRQSGEFVLSLFENLVEMGDLVENDGTIFIERLIELLLEYRSKDRARTMFQKICRKNWANGVLAQLYMQFLETHFPDFEEEISYQKRVLERFDFTIPLKLRKSYSQKCTRFIEKRSRKPGPEFKQLPKPAFGW